MTREAERGLPSTPSPSRGRWWVVAVAVALVAVPLLWAEVPAEIARWYRAAADESELDEDHATALQQMNHAISWNNGDPLLYAHRAALRMEQKDLNGALEDCDRALAIAPPVKSSYALYQRALVYQRLGKHDLALMDIEQLVDLARQGAQPHLVSGDQVFGLDYPAALNLRAYARALAEQDVELGLKDIEEAFQRTGSDDNAAYLDTRGYLRYLAGDLTEAQQDTERAVRMAEQSLAVFESQEPVGDPRVRARQHKQLQQELGVLLQHRGLVYQALQHAEQAADDFRRAEEYGYNPADGVW
jgi:hypothetical protein